VHGQLNDSNSFIVTYTHQDIEYTFGNTQFGRTYYAELIGKERLAKAKPRRKKKAVGQKARPKAKCTAKMA
jgi:hypothetical protein